MQCITLIHAQALDRLKGLKLVRVKTKSQNQCLLCDLKCLLRDKVTAKNQGVNIFTCNSKILGEIGI